MEDKCVAAPTDGPATPLGTSEGEGKAVIGELNRLLRDHDCQTRTPLRIA